MLSQYSVVAAFYDLLPVTEQSRDVTDGERPDYDLLEQQAAAIVEGYNGPRPDPVAVLVLAEEFGRVLDDLRVNVLSPEGPVTGVINAKARTLAAASMHAAALIAAGHDASENLYDEYYQERTPFSSYHLASTTDVERDSIRRYCRLIPYIFIEKGGELSEEAEQRAGISTSEVRAWARRNPPTDW